MTRQYIHPPLNIAPGLLNVQMEQRLYVFKLHHMTLDEIHTGGAKNSTEHSHSVFHVVLFTAGSNGILLNGQRTPVQPGTLVMLPPNIPHLLTAQDPGEARYHEITFSYEYRLTPLQSDLDKLLSYYAGVAFAPFPLTVLLESKKQQELSGLMEQAMTLAFEGGPLIDAYHAVYGVLRFLMRLGVDGAGKNTAPPPVLEAARQRLAVFGPSRPGVKRVAAESGMSVEHFVRSFKAVFGITPGAYQKKRRIHAALQLLRTTNLDCQTIALRLGYSDMFSFSRSFKQSTGRAPRHFRRGAT